MRIISGINKGMKLFAPQGDRVRPTSDKIKEAIFNIIGPLDREATVLELFAGSGSIGIEFLARGAKFCTFVEKSNKSLFYIKKNLDLCKFNERAKIILSDYEKAMTALSKEGEKFDYIFADPPYALNLSNKIYQKVFELKLLKEGGTLIIETDKSEKTIDNTYTDMVEYKEKVYGRTRISIIRHLEDQ